MSSTSRGGGHAPNQPSSQQHSGDSAVTLPPGHMTSNSGVMPPIPSQMLVSYPPGLHLLPPLVAHPHSIDMYWKNSKVLLDGGGQNKEPANHTDNGAKVPPPPPPRPIESHSPLGVVPDTRPPKGVMDMSLLDHEMLSRLHGADPLYMERLALLHGFAPQNGDPHAADRFPYNKLLPNFAAAAQTDRNYLLVPMDGQSWDGIPPPRGSGPWRDFQGPMYDPSNAQEPAHTNRPYTPTESLSRSQDEASDKDLSDVDDRIGGDQSSPSSQSKANRRKQKQPRRVLKEDEPLTSSVVPGEAAGHDADEAVKSTNSCVVTESGPSLVEEGIVPSDKLDDPGTSMSFPPQSPPSKEGSSSHTKLFLAPSPRSPRTIASIMSKSPSPKYSSVRSPSSSPSRHQSAFLKPNSPKGMFGGFRTSMSPKTHHSGFGDQPTYSGGDKPIRLLTKKERILGKRASYDYTMPGSPGKKMRLMEDGTPFPSKKVRLMEDSTPTKSKVLNRVHPSLLRQRMVESKSAFGAGMCGMVQAPAKLRGKYPGLPNRPYNIPFFKPKRKPLRNPVLERTYSLRSKSKGDDGISEFNIESEPRPRKGLRTRKGEKTFSSYAEMAGIRTKGLVEKQKCGKDGKDIKEKGKTSPIDPAKSGKAPKNLQVVLDKLEQLQAEKQHQSPPQESMEEEKKTESEEQVTREDESRENPDSSKSVSKKPLLDIEDQKEVEIEKPEEVQGLDKVSIQSDETSTLRQQLSRQPISQPPSLSELTTAPPQTVPVDEKESGPLRKRGRIRRQAESEAMEKEVQPPMAVVTTDSTEKVPEESASTQSVVPQEESQASNRRRSSRRATVADVQPAKVSSIESGTQEEKPSIADKPPPPVPKKKQKAKIGPKSKVPKTKDPQEEEEMSSLEAAVTDVSNQEAELVDVESINECDDVLTLRNAEASVPESKDKPVPSENTPSESVVAKGPRSKRGKSKAVGDHVAIDLVQSDDQLKTESSLSNKAGRTRGRNNRHRKEAPLREVKTSEPDVDPPQSVDCDSAEQNSETVKSKADDSPDKCASCEQNKTSNSAMDLSAFSSPDKSPKYMLSLLPLKECKVVLRRLRKEERSRSDLPTPSLKNREPTSKKCDTHKKEKKANKKANVDKTEKQNVVESTDLPPSTPPPLPSSQEVTTEVEELCEEAKVDSKDSSEEIMDNSGLNCSDANTSGDVSLVIDMGDDDMHLSSNHADDHPCNDSSDLSRTEVTTSTKEEVNYDGHRSDEQEEDESYEPLVIDEVQAQSSPKVEADASMEQDATTDDGDSSVLMSPDGNRSSFSFSSPSPGRDDTSSKPMYSLESSGNQESVQGLKIVFRKLMPEASVNKKSETPVNKKSETPVNKKAEAPVNKKSETSVSKKSEVPGHKKSEVPGNKKSEIQANKKSEIPGNKKSKSDIGKTSESYSRRKLRHESNKDTVTTTRKTRQSIAENKADICSLRNESSRISETSVHEKSKNDATSEVVGNEEVADAQREPNTPNEMKVKEDLSWKDEEPTLLEKVDTKSENTVIDNFEEEKSDLKDEAIVPVKGAHSKSKKLRDSQMRNLSFEFDKPRTAESGRNTSKRLLSFDKPRPASESNISSHKRLLSFDFDKSTSSGSSSPVKNASIYDIDFIDDDEEKQCLSPKLPSIGTKRRPAAAEKTKGATNATVVPGERKRGRPRRNAQPKENPAPPCVDSNPIVQPKVKDRLLKVKADAPKEHSTQRLYHDTSFEQHYSDDDSPEPDYYDKVDHYDDEGQEQGNTSDTGESIPSRRRLPRRNVKTQAMDRIRTQNKLLTDGDINTFAFQKRAPKAAHEYYDSMKDLFGHKILQMKAQERDKKEEGAGSPAQSKFDMRAQMLAIMGHAAKASRGQHSGHSSVEGNGEAPSSQASRSHKAQQPLAAIPRGRKRVNSDSGIDLDKMSDQDSAPSGEVELVTGEQNGLIPKVRLSLFRDKKGKWKSGAGSGSDAGSQKTTSDMEMPQLSPRLWNDSSPAENASISPPQIDSMVPMEMEASPPNLEAAVNPSHSSRKLSKKREGKKGNENTQKNSARVEHEFTPPLAWQVDKENRLGTEQLAASRSPLRSSVTSPPSRSRRRAAKGSDTATRSSLQDNDGAKSSDISCNASGLDTISTDSLTDRLKSSSTKEVTPDGARDTLSHKCSQPLPNARQSPVHVMPDLFDFSEAKSPNPCDISYSEQHPVAPDWLTEPPGGYDSDNSMADPLEGSVSPEAKSSPVMSPVRTPQSGGLQSPRDPSANPEWVLEFAKRLEMSKQQDIVDDVEKLFEEDVQVTAKSRSSVSRRGRRNSRKSSVEQTPSFRSPHRSTANTMTYDDISPPHQSSPTLRPEMVSEKVPLPEFEPISPPCEGSTETSSDAVRYDSSSQGEFKLCVPTKASLKQRGLKQPSPKDLTKNSRRGSKSGTTPSSKNTSINDTPPSKDTSISSTPMSSENSFEVAEKPVEAEKPVQVEDTSSGKEDLLTSYMAAYQQLFGRTRRQRNSAKQQIEQNIDPEMLTLMETFMAEDTQLTEQTPMGLMPGKRRPRRSSEVRKSLDTTSRASHDNSAEESTSSFASPDTMDDRIAAMVSPSSDAPSGGSHRRESRSRQRTSSSSGSTPSSARGRRGRQAKSSSPRNIDHRRSSQSSGKGEEDVDESLEWVSPPRLSSPENRKHSQRLESDLSDVFEEEIASPPEVDLYGEDGLFGKPPSPSADKTLDHPENKEVLLDPNKMDVFDLLPEPNLHEEIADLRKSSQATPQPPLPIAPPSLSTSTPSFFPDPQSHKPMEAVDPNLISFPALNLGDVSVDFSTDNVMDRLWGQSSKDADSLDEITPTLFTENFDFATVSLQAPLAPETPQKPARSSGGASTAALSLLEDIPSFDDHRRPVLQKAPSLGHSSSGGSTSDATWAGAPMGIYSCALCGAIFDDNCSFQQHEAFCTGGL